MDRAQFFSYLRSAQCGLFGKSLSQNQVTTLEAILEEAAALGLPNAHAAYVMATAYHETGGRLAPIVENLSYTAKRITQVWPSRFATVAAAKPYARNPVKLANKVYGGRIGNTEPGDGYRFLGRGLVQITGRANYRRAGLELGLDLVDNPELALDLKIAARILVRGMVEGWFRNRKLADYEVGPNYDFRAARMIINPDRNGEKIAAEARAFLRAIEHAGGLSAARPVLDHLEDALAATPVRPASATSASRAPLSEAPRGVLAAVAVVLVALGAGVSQVLCAWPAMAALLSSCPN